ncbi:MAG: hypothetical protein AAB036_10295, partial [Elusimicrobiota bacterium]
MRSLRRLALGVLALVLGAVSASAVERIITTSGQTRYPNTRHIAYQASCDAYWFFYTRFGAIYYSAYSSSGTFMASGTAFDPDPSISGYGSIWHQEGDNQIYVMGAPAADGGAISLRRGTLLNAADVCDGSITWGVTQTRSPAVNLGGGPGQTLSGATGGITRRVDGLLATVAGGLRTTAARNGFEGVLGMSVTGTNEIHDTDGTAVANGSANNGTYANQTLAGVIPLGTNQVLISYRDGGASAPNLVIDRYAAAVRTNERTADAMRATTLTADGDGFSLTKGTGTESAHIVYIDSVGDLRYMRRGGTAGAPVYFGPITLDNRNALFTNPSIAYVSSGTAGGNDLIVIVYSSATGSNAQLNYIIGNASATTTPTPGVSDSSWTFVTGWKISNTVNYDYPVAIATATSPSPVAVIYEGPNGSVRYDVIPISTYPAINISGANVVISSVPNTAPYTASTYDLIITTSAGAAIGFQWIPELRSPSPIATLLNANGTLATELVVSSFTYLDQATGRITVRVVPGANFNGGPYDLVVINADGRESRRVGALSIPKPTLTQVTVPEVGVSSNSGAGFPNNSATTNMYRNVTLRGTGFMNWYGQGGAASTLRLYTSTGPTGALISAVSVSTVDIVSVGGGVSVITTRLKISTSAPAGGPYAVQVLNPTLSSNTLSNPATFFITIATSGVTWPVADANGNATYFSSVTGNMWFTPQVLGASYADPAVLYNGSPYMSTQLRIKRVSDGYYWRPAPNNFFDAPTNFTEEDKFFALTATNSWTYVLPAGAAADGDYEYTARGRTYDQPKDFSGNPTLTGGPESATVHLIKDTQGPLTTVTRPARAGGAKTDTAFPLTLTISDARGSGSTGSGIKKVYFVIMTTAPLNATPNCSSCQYITGTDTKTWVSWYNNAGTWEWDTTPNVMHWISTVASANIPMTWNSKTLFQAVAIASYPATNDVLAPNWVNGKEYFIAAVSSDNVGHLGTSETTQSTGAWSDATPGALTGYRFIYDVSTPTLTAFAGVVDLSTATDLVSSDTHTWLSAVLSSGTVTDNVSSLIDPRLIFMRIFDMDAQKYLNPNTLITFNVSNAALAWAQQSVIADLWSFDLSQAQFVNGNRYSIELYAQDGAGNFDSGELGNSCLITTPFTSPTCLTGSATLPKYVRYFKFNKALPVIAISTPTVTAPNNIGGNSTLATISGTAVSIGGSVINRVEYYLTYSDLSKRWDTASQSWIATTPGDLWSQATYYITGSSWSAQDVSWVESQSYIFSVRAVDAAGNTSNAASISFNYDIAAPVSVVTSPAAQSALTSRVATITGTAVDQISTGTPTGLSTDFRAAIKRLSDDYWWDGSTWTATTGGVYESSIPVTLGSGLGVKTWSLSLPSTFYDLLAATDTFKVFTWAKDLVNNPPSAVNVESSTTVKLVFSYASSTPTLTSISPVASTATNVVNSFAINLDPVGGRIRQVWTVFMTTDNYYWQGSSWSAVQTSDPPPFGGVWLSTDNHVGGRPTPDMTFAPGSTPDGTSAVTLTFLPLASGTTIQMPDLTSGRRYKIYVRALNTAGHILNTGLDVSTHVFVYDVTAPTVTAHYSIMSLSTSSVGGDPTNIPSLSVASGTVSDNISDALDPRRVFFRIRDLTAGKYLNPATLIKFDVTDANAAWSESNTTGNTWSYDLSLAQFVNGNQYKLEVFGDDAAGNNQAAARAGATGCPVTLNSDTLCQTGSAVNPKYVRYFRYNRLPPTISIVTPLTTTPNNMGAGALTTITGVTTDPGGAGINRVEYSLKFADSSMRWVTHTSTAGAWKTSAQQPSDYWNYACDPVVGCGSSGATWAVWESSNIAWVDGTNYIYEVRAYDAAGNVSNTGIISFNYDVSKPVSVVASPAAQSALTSRVATITGTALDEVSTGTPAGLSSDFRAAIKRLSDDYWWDGGTWTATTGGVYESSVAVSLGTGLGVKTWSLSLPSTFYDLLAATDTFKVFTWAKDLVNNAPAAVNVESSTTVKLVFSYASSTPTLTSQSPTAGSASNVALSVTLNLDPVGGRIKQVWAAFIDTDTAGPYYWTGSSWSANGTTDPPAVNSAVWLSTDAQVAGTPSPDMIFTPGTTPDGTSPVTITFSGGTSLLKPAWVDGRKYKIYTRARNTAGQE